MTTLTKIPIPNDQDASGRTLGDEEIKLLTDVIKSGVLTSTKGTFVKKLEQSFAQRLGVKYAYACASGSAAVHCNIAAIDPEPGDEIITTPITDMGALAPIVYQGAIPVFADVDPKTYNVTAKTIEKCLSKKTKAIIVTHLFGNPCEMGPIMELANAAKVPVIEDCAQSFMAKCDGKYVGTFGAANAFSLQQGKHITTGEGGIVVSNDDHFARRMFLFINKAWGYGDKNPDHYFLALNYRMSELQGAVAVAQLEKLQFSVDQRVAMAKLMTSALAGIPGIETPMITKGAEHTFWKYCLRVDPNVIQGGGPALAKVLATYGIASAPRYIQKPAFACQVFREQVTFGKSRFPFNLARPEAVNYDPAQFPGSYEALDRILVMPWNERYTKEHVDYIARAVRESCKQCTGAGNG